MHRHASQGAIQLTPRRILSSTNNQQCQTRRLTWNEPTLITDAKFPLCRIPHTMPNQITTTAARHPGYKSKQINAVNWRLVCEKNEWAQVCGNPFAWRQAPFPGMWKCRVRSFLLSHVKVQVERSWNFVSLVSTNISPSSQPAWYGRPQSRSLSKEEGEIKQFFLSHLSRTDDDGGVEELHQIKLTII